MKEIIITLAKVAIANAIGHTVPFDIDKTLQRYPQLKEPGASFVTISRRSDNTLRGCIGSLQAYRPLYKDIILNAKSAALNDPRFPPLRLDELDQIKIEVSILSKPQEITYTSISDLKTKIRPEIDGVILKHANHQATYLPQVWKVLPNFDRFFASLCKKARLDADCLKLYPKISTYQVKKYEEK